MAAPTKRVPDVRRTILAALELGATKTDAAHAAGVAYETLRTWGEEDPAFSAALKAAQAKCRVRSLGIIKRAAASGSWQAAAWVCERTDPENYGRTVQDQRHTGKDGAGPVVISYIEAPPPHDPAALRDDA